MGGTTAVGVTGDDNVVDVEGFDGVGEDGQAVVVFRVELAVPGRVIG